MSIQLDGAATGSVACRLSVFVLIFLVHFAAKAQEDSWWEPVSGVSMPRLVAEGWEIMAFDRLRGSRGGSDIYILQHAEIPGAWRCVEGVDVLEGALFSCQQLRIAE